VEGAKALIALAVLFKWDALGLDQGHKVNVSFYGLDLFFFYHISFSLLPAEVLTKAGCLL
jgi:hypothetical protein